MNLLRFLCFIVLVCCISIPIGAATVILKNGKSVEGIVEDENKNSDNVRVITAGGVMEFPRDAIAKIEKSSNVSDILVAARAKENTGNFVEAIYHYAEAIHTSEKPTQKENIARQQENAIRKYVRSLDKKDPLTEGLDAIRQIEELKTQISDSTNLALLQSARIDMDKAVVNSNYQNGEKQEKRSNYEEAIQSFQVIDEYYPEHPLARNLNRRITKLYVEWGIQQYKKGDVAIQKLRDIFQNALERDPENSRAKFYLGKIAWDNKMYDRAEMYLSQVDASALPSRETTWLSNMLRQVQRINSEPQTRTQPRTVATPEPEPTPAPGFFNNMTDWFNNAWNNSKKFATGLADGSGASMGQAMNLLKYIGIGLGILIVFWYIPMKILLSDLPKRRVVYNNWRAIVKYTGALGLLLYFIDRWRREEPRKRCPACNRIVDNPDSFENFDFSKCPYCEANIKPPFTIPDIIKGKTQSMILSKQISSGAGPQDEEQRQQMLYIVNMIMIYGRKIRASDIHIEPEEGNLLIRYRVDGVMAESITLDMQLTSFLVSSIKVVCNLNIAEKRLPQDGHFRRVLMGDEVNVRVSTIPTRGGEKVVMRLLDQKIATATLDSLGIRDEALEAYRQAIKTPHGLILATGPTGSGKTTLQYASLQFINDGSKNITTVEDPIEYELDGINQVQHNTATGLTFATALRSILRQDPDVIMVGEVRALETASIAVNAALTGHLVFSTLHTIDTSTALSRLIDIGVDVKLLSSAILNIVAQRLVRKLCPHCKKQTSASASEMKKLGREGKMLEGKTVYKAKGCSECGGTGYIGRVGIYEMLVPNREIRTLVENGASAMDIHQASRNAGMKTLREEGIYKILYGITSVDEVIRVTSDDAYDQEPETVDAETANQPT